VTIALLKEAEQFMAAVSFSSTARTPNGASARTISSPGSASNEFADAAYDPWKEAIAPKTVNQFTSIIAQLASTQDAARATAAKGDQNLARHLMPPAPPYAVLAQWN
jgi:hypothetical protein